MQSYRACKTLWKSCVEHHTFFRLHTPQPPARRFVLSLGSRFRYSGRTEFQTLEEGRRRARLERTFLRSPSKRFARQTVPPPVAEERLKGPPVAPPRPPSTLPHKVTSLGPKEPRKAWAEGAPSDDEGGFLERADEVIAPRAPSRAEAESEQALTPEEVHSLVVIRMRPDEQGRFGFNVKGGSDLGLPVLVSRVAPNTPADRCYPRLSEGDQVLFINSRDVAGLTHEQVVGLIRSSRDVSTGELALTVRPNVYVAEDEEEPPFQYVPDVPHVAPHVPRADALAESMLLLADGLASGALLAQFEQLYRKKPGLSTSEARRSDNVAKNRYRDIAPYDSTRVVLRGSQSGDYINANYVNMEIPGSGIINRYIATQGPLPNTCDDFWLMAWEVQCPLIVMVTTVVERGRIKCHRYWPDVGQSIKYGPISVSCRREETTPSFAFREFTVIHSELEEERHISHMQYVAWPDHGVPEEATDFLEFVSRVRSARAGLVEPVIVHCSAGIGRTGVLILMETAMCLVEANEPVYPLDIVRGMRDQRAMMIQTASQYKFVCECVHRAYTEQIVKPLPEFRR